MKLLGLTCNSVNANKQLNLVSPTFASRKYDEFLLSFILIFHIDIMEKKPIHLLLFAALLLPLVAPSHFQPLNTFPDVMDGQQQPSSPDLECGFTDHFMAFLKKTGYTDFNFDRPDVKCGAFGGKANGKDIITRIPIVFVHGTCDVGYGRGGVDGYQTWQTGFRSLVQYFTQIGYQKSEMYITTWGPANNSQITSVYHSKSAVMGTRKFIEAVLTYTGAQQIHVIAHSNGVAIARKAIKGGSGYDHIAGSYDPGMSISSRVKTFIGIAGVNLGLMQCIPNIAFNYCNKVDGLFPGATSFSQPSTFLANVNAEPGREGQNVYTVWSKWDELILNECVVWGKITCRINGQQGQIEKTTTDWGHFALRDRIGPDIINWL